MTEQISKPVTAIPEQKKSIQKVANKVGRPTTITEDVVLKLIAALQHGYSLTIALEMAHISKSMYYARYEKDEAFQYRIDDAKNFSTALAGTIVHDVLMDAMRDKPLVDKDGNVYLDKYGRVIKQTKYKEHNRIETAKWYLERKDKTSFGNKELEEDPSTVTNNNLFILSDGQLSKIISESGLQNIDPVQLLKATEAQYVGGVNTEERTAPIHTQSVQSEHTTQGNMPKPPSTV